MNFEELECHSTLDFGFRLLRDKQDLKLRLTAAGTPGLISYMYALIRSGTCDRQDIIEDVLDITGPHMEGTVEQTLTDLEGFRWVALGGDTYQAIEPVRELI